MLMLFVAGLLLCVDCVFMFFFFFFKQKTAYEMRISDWSSDVCSSDLGHFDDGTRRDGLRVFGDVGGFHQRRPDHVFGVQGLAPMIHAMLAESCVEIGRA